MKYPILVHEFSFNKIKNGSRKVGVHLLDKKSQQVKLHDILEMHNRANGEVIECEVKGIAILIILKTWSRPCRLRRWGMTAKKRS